MIFRNAGRWKGWGAAMLLSICILAFACSSSLADGDHLVEVELEGGTGRASLLSPAAVRIDGDEAQLELVFSSPNYTWVKLEGEEERTTSVEDEHSVCWIPVQVGTQDVPFDAETTAMSEPHTISYVLHIDWAGARAQ